MKQLYTPKLPQNHKYKPIGDVYYNAMLSIWSRFIVLYVFMVKELVMAREECKRSADRRCEMEELLCKILKIFLAGQSHKACITSVTFQYVSSLKGDEKAIWLKVNTELPVGQSFFGKQFAVHSSQFKSELCFRTQFPIQDF